MTFRAVVLGLLAACFVAGAGYLNDWVAMLSPLVENHFPTSVFGLLFIVVMLVNPVLRRLRAKWAFRPAEFAVIVTLMLVACSIPNAGLMLYFPRAVVMPIHHNKVMPGWRRYHLLDYVPPSMMVPRTTMVDGKQVDSTVVEGFVRGMGETENPIGLSDVPWDEWSAPLTTWIPLILLVGLAVICLSLIVHRQWSRHESLRYPIADFATSLMGEGSQKGQRSIFRNRLFWIGVGVLLAIHLVNGLHAWFTESIEIPMDFNLAPLAPKLPRTLRAWTLQRLHIFPIVIAFCFLVSSEVSFSLGISQVAFVFLAVPLVKSGVDMSDSWWSGGVNRWQRFGSYVGVALLILYTGRHYYWKVLTQAVTFRRRKQVEGHVAWACRIFILALTVLVALLCALGLDWPLSVLFVLMIMMIFLVIARVNTESGLFVMAPFWNPMAVFMGLFGAAALGPQAIVVIGLLTLVFVVDASNCLMPYLANGLKMCDAFKVSPSRVGWGAAGTFVLALVIAVPVVLWAVQNYGAQDPKATWSTSFAPKGIFDNAERAAAKLTVSAELEKSKALSAWQRVTHMDPERRFIWAAGVGLLLVVVFSALRLRFTWWPIHPVMFVVWGTWAIGFMAYSFFLGWFIRRMVTKFGGVQKYRQVRVLMFGVIAGDLLGRLIFMIVGAIYYAGTGRPPPEYGIFSS